MTAEHADTHSSLKVWTSDFVAGTVAGIVGKVVEYPFDTVKVRLQTMSSGSVGGMPVFNGPLDCIHKTFRKDGFRGFYRGLSSPVLGAALETAVVFSVFGQMARVLGGNSSEDLTMPQVVVAAGVAGFAVSHVLTPVELVKCRIQVQTNATASTAVAKYRGPWDCIRSIAREEGVLGLFRGYRATIIREMPGNAVWFGFYELSMRALTPPNAKRKDTPAYLSAVAGACGGLGTWLTMFPVDTVKSRMQTGVGKGISDSFYHSFRNILASEGLRGMYSGVTVTAITSIPANGIMWLTYAYVSRTVLQL